MNRDQRILLSIILVVLAAAAVFWGVRNARNRVVAIPDSHPAVSADSLYESGDRPTTIFIRVQASSSGETGSVPVVIRQSRSRLNQMKQAVLAFLKGTSANGWRGLSPKGVTLNQMYLTTAGSAVVDLSVPASENFGFFEEASFAYGLTYTLTQNFQEVKRVRLLNEGHESGTLTGHYALGTVESLSAPVSGAAVP